MIENLAQLVQQFAGEAIVNNSAIPNDKNNSVINEVTAGIFEGLKKEATGGGLEQVLGMFSKGSSSSGIGSSLTQSIQNTVVSSLMNKFGVTNPIAQGIAQQMVPSVLGALAKNTNDPNNSDFNINGVLSSITGGKTAGMDIQGMLDKFAGGADGKFDLSDVMNLLGKGNNNDSQSQQGGSILGALGSLFK